MFDLVKQKGIDINVNELQQRLGIRIVPVSALKQEGIEELKQAIVNPLPVPVHDIFETQSLAPDVLKSIRQTLNTKSNYSAFQIANHIEAIPFLHINKQQQDEIITLIQEHTFDVQKLQSYETMERYKVIHAIMQLSVTDILTDKKPGWNKRIDSFLMHRFWGYLFFLLIMFSMFQAIFTLAQYPMDWIDKGFALAGNWLSTNFPHGKLNDLIVNGIVAGIGGIVIFIPQIALLFTFIAILEDTGYMARVSFLMDKMMRKFGLNGRSVIPLISGIACAARSRAHREWYIQ